MQAPVSQEHVHSFHPQLRISSKTQIWEWTAHLFLPSVLTVIGAPRRAGPRNIEPGPLMVSVEFQLSVLELVAELLRTAPSFLVIIDH